MASTNIINAAFGSGLCAVTTSAFRANYGMVLRFSGIDLPTAFEVDFSNYDVAGHDSITAIGQNGEVQIPDDLWDSGLNIYAYVYLHPTDDSGVTVYTVTIPVLGRPNRTDEEPTPHEQTAIEQAISALNEAVEQTAADVETTTANAQAAAQSEANASVSERAAAASASAALASQNAAESASQSATESASGASESARNAAQSASAAAESATSAQASAEQAERSVQSITDDVERAERAATTATGKATEAASSAATASTKAAQAEQSATAAAQSASSASTAAQNAAESEQLAESHATDAETAKQDAQDAQEAAEAAQAAAEQASDDAESAADRAEQAEQEVLSAMDGTYENLTSGNAQQLLSTVTESDSVPYLFRQTAKNADRAYLDEVVGGTVAWNQLSTPIDNAVEQKGVTITPNGDGSVSITGTTTASGALSAFKNISTIKNHKYLVMAKGLVSGISIYTDIGGPVATNGTIRNATEDKSNSNVTLRTDTGVTYNAKIWDSTFDLTQMFGSTIADYIYNLETATAGAGVAYFRKLFPNDYYEYNSGELLSVEGVSAHTMMDADGNVISTYPLDSSLTLRGVPKLNNGKLYYDGDRYLPDGTVERLYAERAYQSGDESLTDAITDGTKTVYKLSTTTTETATPYRHLQICDPNGTEEFVSTGIVPVGHNTRYPENLRAKIEGLPWNFNSIIAMAETTTTASKAYSVGDYFILNNVLYRVTSAIASGGTITIGTNCRATTIMDEIKALS